MAETKSSNTKDKRIPRTKAGKVVAAKAVKARKAVKKLPVKPVTKLEGFAEFIRKQGVVGLAVGLAIGTAATTLVKSMVDNMINPLVGAVLPGSTDLNSKFVCIGKEGAECVNKLAYGPVVSNLISFIAVAAVIYFVIMGLRLDKLDKKKD